MIVLYVWLPAPASCLLDQTYLLCPPPYWLELWFITRLTLFTPFLSHLQLQLEPTHQVVRLAKEAGFTNVHDYLVHVVTCE
jgi:hypothetical protein